MGGVIGFEDGRGHLVEERGEDVVVVLVDHRHVHRGVVKGFRRGQSPEPGSDDDDSRIGRAHQWAWAG